MTDLPIVCTLSADDLRQRRGDLLPGLIALAEERADVPDGCRWRFASSDDLLWTIVSVIDAERACCRFLRFQLTMEPGLGPVWLEVTGPAGTREFLQELATPASSSRHQATTSERGD